MKRLLELGIDPDSDEQLELSYDEIAPVVEEFSLKELTEDDS